jgi:GNAT superfamily N-acetyltransferase
MAPSDPALEVETPLRASELDQAEALVREAGWNQVAADWRTFLELGTVHAVRTSSGQVVATAATLPHDGRFAWISMVLVNGAYRRRGLATRLLRRCIDDITSAGLVAILDATPDGREVYRTLGFQDCWGYHRLILREPPRLSSANTSTEIAIKPIDDSIWPQLCAYDATAFGARREAMLGRLRGRLAQAELYAMRGGRLCGFLLGRDGQVAGHLGPLIADADDIAQELLRHALRSLQAPVSIDLADAKIATRAMLEDAGFRQVRPLTRMLFQRSERFDDAQRTYAVVGPEFG